PAVLVEHGYNTMALGKWHLAPDEHISAAGPYDRWPLGRGFERFYGFLPGETDQWHPDLWYDNHRIEPPRTPEEGYHLSADLVDKAIEFINEQKAVTAEKPFFTYLAFGAHHAPHHAPREYIDRYQGRFDDGWDVIHQETLARQIELGIVPAGTQLPPRNPGVKAWDAHTENEQRVLRRQMEVYAAFMSHTDDQIGRLLEFLAHIGQMENTLVILISDNGASGEGGPMGLASEMSYFNMASESTEDMLAVLDQWGMPGLHPHYATGWAMVGNTPQRWYKQQVHEGGVRDPLIIHWPARIHDRGVVRTQFHHVTDIFPTILEVIGIEMPEVVRGHKQIPLEGVSMAYSLTEGAAATRKTQQYFEIFGHRALWKDGWKAVTFHWTKYLNMLYSREGVTHDMDFDADDWELYNMNEDFSEMNSLAHTHSDKLEEMIEAWWEEARKYNVLPLDDSNAARLQVPKPVVFKPRDRYTFYAPVRIVRPASPDVRRRTHSIIAEVTIPEGGCEGAIVSNGSHDGGYTLYVKDGKAHYLVNYLAQEYYSVSSERLPTGPVTLRVDFVSNGDLSGQATLSVNGQAVGDVLVEKTNPAAYAVAEGLEIGGDGSVAVAPDYASPYPFTGVIRKVELLIGKGAAADHEADARVAGYRQ
ncbi:MAG: arylsulfatase, partial [Caldilinea sp.]